MKQEYTLIFNGKELKVFTDSASEASTSFFNVILKQLNLEKDCRIGFLRMVICDALIYSDLFSASIDFNPETFETTIKLV